MHYTLQSQNCPSLFVLSACCCIDHLMNASSSQKEFAARTSGSYESLFAASCATLSEAILCNCFSDSALCFFVYAAEAQLSCRPGCRVPSLEARSSISDSPLPSPSKPHFFTFQAPSLSSSIFLVIPSSGSLTSTTFPTSALTAKFDSADA